MHTIPSDHPVLTYRVREPRVKAATQKAVILLHGVGSNENDLFGLADQLPDDVYVIAPRGPFTLGPSRFARYNVNFSTGKPVIDARQEASSREVIYAFVQQVKQTYYLDEVYLGGFSQGAIMSYSVGLTHPKEIQGIIALSGRLLDQIKPLVSKHADLRQLKLFIAHGIGDNVLAIHYARVAKSYLESLPVAIDYHEYEMAHSINTAVLHDLNVWLTLKQS